MTDTEQADTEEGTDRGGPLTWFLMYIVGTGSYIAIFYALTEYIGIGWNLAFFLYVFLPFLITYINKFYEFYVNEFDPDETPLDKELDTGE